MQQSHFQVPIFNEITMNQFSMFENSLIENSLKIENCDLKINSEIYFKFSL